MARQWGKPTTQWGAAADCETNGCDPHHADGGRIIICESEDEASYLAKWGVNNHKYTRVARDLPLWEER